MVIEGVAQEAQEYRQSYRRDIDGLRAIAVASVVLFHAGLQWSSGGFSGVDIFFVISGFLIGGIVYREVRYNSFRFSIFYARRARRIVPALIVTIFGTTIISAAILSPSEYANSSMSAAAALLGISNFRFWKGIDYFSADSGLNPFLMTWSLGVEEQFYIILPFIMIVTKKINFIFIIVFLSIMVVSSFTLSQFLTIKNHQMAFYLLPPRAWELTIGVIFAVYIASGRPFPKGKTAQAISIVGTALLIKSIIFVRYSLYWPGYEAAIPVIGTIALIATPDAYINRRLLSSRPLVAIGLVSYSWYLWHWPLFALVRISDASSPSPTSLYAMVAVSLCVAFLSWRYVEQPFRRTILTSNVANFRYATVLLVLSATMIAVVVAKGIPSRVAPQVVQIDRSVKLVQRYPCLARNENTPDFKRCIVDVPGRPMVAILGDSHAAALAPGIVRLASKARYGSAVLTKAGCRPLYGATIRKGDDPEFAASCLAFMQTSFNWVRNKPDVKIVIMAGFWSGVFKNPMEHYVTQTGSNLAGNQTILLQGISNAIEDLRKTGKSVILAEDVPYWNIDPVRKTLGDLIFIRRIISDNTRDTVALSPEPQMDCLDNAIKQTTISSGGIYIPLRRLFCSKDICRPSWGDRLLFVDRSHLSDAGADLVAIPFKQYLR